MGVESKTEEDEASDEGDKAVVQPRLEGGQRLTDADAAAEDRPPRQEPPQETSGKEEGGKGQDKGESVHGIDPMMNNTVPPTPGREG